MTTPTPLALPPELTIYTVAEVLPQWLAWLGQAPPDGDTATVNGAEVGEIDGAGVQMLVSLQRALAQRERRLQIETPSAALQAACQAAGLSDWLQSAHGAEVAA